ncbi:sulfurtransferase complex subunit TusC [Haliea sp. E1-2-M8]|uniref:sulfurtransferase complex subunit TusC n=1 Tax=Haliea sp. E1-2-M8 TaxID=3064706 RepID=UPI0027262753|nr:sulfurtransferase complex subunit TusC [Haliea sp. E1-2-M8]MDO8863536.1 sulfurtransferase complex subunit TusC [Haliea sp. E1-2-M8]
MSRMTAAARKSILVVSRHAHPGSSLPRSALDTALAAAAFDQPVALLFQGEGVLQLLSEQDSRAAGVRNLRKVLDSLPLYEIETLHVDAAAAAAFGLDRDALPAGAEWLDAAGIRALLARHDHVLGF